MNIIRMLTMLLMIIIAGVEVTGQGNKSDIKVLVVAHNPETMYNKAYSGPKPTKLKIELANKRGEEYKSFLSEHFNVVDVVNSDSYNSALSYKYDVTIFDDLPAPIESADFGLFRYGKSMIRGGKTLTYPRYLPIDFDRAVIAIGDLTDDLTYMIPSKFLTQCHCIDYGYALNTKEGHAIFNEPQKIDLDYVNVETPRSFKSYYSGAHLSDSIEAWWVQTKSAADGDGYWVGQILTGLGFDDSPDCEFISGSNSLKDINGMALGRSGNIFHWGFSASPDYMTTQAKKVFVNTIHYMANFNGKQSVTQYKSNSRLGVNNECFAKTNLVLDLENDVKTGNTAIDSIYNYYRNNYCYFYYDGLNSTLLLDEDAKKLGIANNDIQLIEKCIDLLIDGKDVELVQRLLLRYTDQSFTDPEGWRTWYEKFGEYLYFSEIGGYKFRVDTYSHEELKMLSGSIVTKNDKPINLSQTVEFEEENLVLKGQLIKTSDNTSRVQLDLIIKEGLHIYANVPENGFFIKTEINVETPEGVVKNGDLICPKSFEYEDAEGVTLFKGSNRFIQNIEFKEGFVEGGSIKCFVYYQACDKYKCFPPNMADIVIKY